MSTRDGRLAAGAARWYGRDMATGSALVAKPLTYEDYCALPDDGKRYEVLDGVLVVSPAPVPRHQGVSLRLAALLERYARTNRLGRVYAAPIDVLLSRTTICQPDIVFVARANEHLITERAIEGAPDLLVEILSPSTARRDRGIKARLYGRLGVAHYWIVDPKKRRLEAFARQGATFRRVLEAGENDVVSPPPFERLRIALGELWE
jgi:Uma2 family endonuclease